MILLELKSLVLNSSKFIAHSQTDIETTDQLTSSRDVDYELCLCYLPELKSLTNQNIDLLLGMRPKKSIHRLKS